jgi:hypothetical protein
MKENKIIQILSSKKINMSLMVRELSIEGLSVPSLYNKMNPTHKHRFKEKELDVIENYLKELSLFISDF